jgi:D-sedoheptulose 7-phosphate isomerase
LKIQGSKTKEDAKMKDAIEKELETHIHALSHTITNQSTSIETIIGVFVQIFQKGNKVLLCGNGGSAADAQHVAGEFVNRFRFDRPALAAIALTTDTSVLTCIGNDSDYQNVFSRQVEAIGRAGDILVGISTSGASPNVIAALKKARELNMVTIGFTGQKGKEKMAPYCDHVFSIASDDTPRIQECHEFVWHVICGQVEKKLFGK